MGYFSNFVGRVCDYLDGKDFEKVNGVDYTVFELQIVIPKSIERNMQSRASSYYRSHGFVKHMFDPGKGRPIETTIAADKENPRKLLICDLPTSLTPLYDAIEMYLQKGHLGKSKEQELIETREMHNFVRVLETKISESAFSQGIVRFVEE